MILHRQNFIESLSILSAENDQIQIRVKGEQAILQTQHTEILVKTREVDNREFAVLYCPITEHNLVFKKLCKILNVIQDEYIKINFIYDVATEEQSIVVFNDTFKGAINTKGYPMEHIDIDHAAATELFTITDEIYAALTTAKEHTKDEEDSVCISQSHIFATSGHTAFLYPNQSAHTFPIPQSVINSRMQGATIYIKNETVYIINRNFKQRINTKNQWSYSRPERLANVLEMMEGEKSVQTVSTRHLSKSVAIAKAMKSVTVSLSIRETACVDMYSNDVTGSTTINGSGDEMSAEIVTAQAEKILDSPFSQKCETITIGTHKMVLSLNLQKATFLATNKAYSAREREVIRRYINGDDSVLLGWSNPYELFKNDYKPWIEVRNEEIARERKAQNIVIIQGLRTKLVDIDKAKIVKQQQEEYAALTKELSDLIDHRSSYEPKSADTLAAELNELEKEHEAAKLIELEQQAEFEKIEDSKERNAALRAIRCDQHTRNSSIKLRRDRLKQVTADERQIRKLQKQATDIDNKIKSQTFILSNTLEQLEAHNADIEAQIQEILCKQ